MPTRATSGEFFASAALVLRARQRRFLLGQLHDFLTEIRQL